MRLHVVAALVVCSPARAQWVVSDLHPMNATWSEAQAVSEAVEVGTVIYGGYQHASVWNGSAASWVDIHPAGAWRSNVLGMSGDQLVGYAFVMGFQQDHACLWNTTTGSWIDLHPAGATSSYAEDAEPGRQVGWVRFGTTDSTAALWSGSAASWVNLNPPGAVSSKCEGASGGRQAGMAVVGGQLRAILWSGSAASWVDLSPAGSPSSVAHDISGGQQVGAAIVAGVPHACLWSGSAASWVDLHPVGVLESRCRATDGTHQAGYVFLGPYQSPRASFWSGTAESWVDLHALLPEGFTSSSAYGIWSDPTAIRVVGYGYKNGGRALLWTKYTCYPDCNTDGTLTLADFACFQNKFATQSAYADCTNDTLFNLADFGCFQSKFVLACP